VAKAEAKITDFMATGWFWVGFRGEDGCLLIRNVLDLLQASFWVAPVSDNEFAKGGEGEINDKILLLKKHIV
jgi:hypothetical protein